MLHFSLVQIINSTLVLFSVIDILGAIPIILDLREKVGNIESGKASIASAIIMLAFLFLGEQMLYLMGLDISSFAIAGSIVIFFIALEMILGIRIYKDAAPETASIVPIAFPLIAGAGVFTTILSIRAEYYTENIVVAILINILFVFIILKNTDRIAKILGKNGVNILRKIFGVILLAIAVKLFKSNLGF
jgi:multiple antibiotic resistance protein